MHNTISQECRGKNYKSVYLSREYDEISNIFSDSQCLQYIRQQRAV